MNIIEARRTRHLIVRLDRGDELPAALLRALDEAEARAGWIEGTGSLEAVEIALFDQGARAYGKTRRLGGPCEVVALSGSVAQMDGEGHVRLSATLARESDVGLQLLAGELVWARAYALELRVTALDDVTLTRVTDHRTGLPLLTTSSPLQPTPVASLPAASAPLPTASAPQPAASISQPSAPAPQPAAPSALQPPASTPTPAEPARAAFPSTPAVEPVPLAPPQRPARPRQEEEIYPEVGDTVTHFHFGECEVITSDGERIRLRQERDGRVREVSLTMLRIEPPTVDPSTGKRHFRLARKN